MLRKRELNLDDLLFNYGLRFNADVLLDLNSLAIPMDVGGGKIELVSWPLHPLIVPDSPHPLVKNLTSIRTEYLGSLDTVAVEGIRKEFLLYSSPYVRSLVPGTLLSLDLVQQLPPAEAFLAERLPVAVLLEGQFPSAYSHRVPPEGIGSEFQVSGESREGRIFAVADGEVFINQVNPNDLSAYPLGWDRFAEQQYGNKALLLNLMDYFLDSPELMQLRQKEIHLRPVNTLLWHQEKTKWRLITLVLPLLVTILAGGTYLRMRYRRYRRR